MTFRISGKNFDIGKSLRERIGMRIDEAAAKYINGGYSGHATVNKDGHAFRTKCELHLDLGVVMEAEGTDADAYLSADQAAVRIEKQLRRFHRRMKDRSGSKIRRGLKPIAEVN